MRRGYTLAELLVVMIIAGVCAAVALPAFTSGEHRDPAYRAAEQIAAIIRRASLASIRSGQRVDVLIRIDERRYAIESNGANPQVTDTGALDIPASVHEMGATGGARFVLLPNSAAWGDSIVIVADTTRIVLRINAMAEVFIGQ